MSGAPRMAHRPSDLTSAAVRAVPALSPPLAADLLQLLARLLAWCCDPCIPRSVPFLSFPSDRCGSMGGGADRRRWSALGWEGGAAAGAPTRMGNRSDPIGPPHRTKGNRSTPPPHPLHGAHTRARILLTSTLTSPL